MRIGPSNILPVSAIPGEHLRTTLIRRVKAIECPYLLARRRNYDPVFD